MTDLSPAAQAIEFAIYGLCLGATRREIAAAALRAASDQVTADSIMDGLSGVDGEGWYLMEERKRVAAQLLAIAAELEAQP